MPERSTRTEAAVVDVAVEFGQALEGFVRGGKAQSSDSRPNIHLI